MQCQTVATEFELGKWPGVYFAIYGAQKGLRPTIVFEH